MDTLAIFQHAENARHVGAGEVVFSTGDPGDLMYVPIEGAVDIRVGATTVETVVPGGIFGEMALLDASPRSATAVATADCRLAPVDGRRFQMLVQHNPFFAIHVMKVMADRLRHTNQRLADGS